MASGQCDTAEASLGACAGEAEAQTSNLPAACVARLPTPRAPPPNPSTTTPRGSNTQQDVLPPHPGCSTSLRPPLAPTRAPDPPGHTGPPPWGRATQGPAGRRRDWAILPAVNRRSTGPGQEVRRSTNRLERPYRRPVRVTRAVGTSSRQEGGRARAPRVRARTHT